VVPFQSCVRQCRPVSMMAAIIKNGSFFKWPKLLYFKLESAKIWNWPSGFWGEDFYVNFP
jgi:hypothetical protein